jgi:hypothetical protein
MMIERAAAAKAMRGAVDDVEVQLFHEIKTQPENRATLLAQLDVLTNVKDRINARIYDLGLDSAP